MNKKKLIVIVLVVISCLIFFSAGVFAFGSNAHDVGGIKFNLPNDFKEVSKCDSLEPNQFNGCKVESKCFENDVSNGATIKPNCIVISVVSGPNLSLNNISNFSDSRNRSLDKADFNDTTMAGFKGLLSGGEGELVYSHPSASHYDFFYMKGDKLVNIQLHGWPPYIEKNQIEDIIK